MPDTSPTEILLCPHCGDRIACSKSKPSSSIQCVNCNEEFDQNSHYVNLMKSPGAVSEEIVHWDGVAASGPSLILDPIIEAMSEEPRRLISSNIKKVTGKRSLSNIVIAELGCGAGQSAWHLSDVAVKPVSYYGIDVSAE